MAWGIQLLFLNCDDSMGLMEKSRWWVLSPSEKLVDAGDSL